MSETSSSDRLHTFSLYGALLVTWVAMLGSLYFSEVRHFVPCTLCWYQRILMYPLALLIAVGLLRRDRHLPMLVLPFSLIGQGVSTYHYLIQKTTIFGAPTACSTGVPCTTAWINWLGFITIPFLAMLSFMLITVFCVVAIYRGELADQESHLSWQPVAIIVGLTLIGYIVLAQVSGTATAQGGSNFIVATVAENPDAFTPVEPMAADSTLVAEGRQLYLEACAACHGPNAEGVANLGVDLTASEFLNSHTDEDVVAMIRAGRLPDDPENTTGLAMPPSGGRPDLSDEQLLAIVDYLRSKALETK